MCIVAFKIIRPIVDENFTDVVVTVIIDEFYYFSLPVRENMCRDAKSNFQDFYARTERDKSEIEDIMKELEEISNSPEFQMMEVLCD